MTQVIAARLVWVGELLGANCLRWVNCLAQGWVNNLAVHKSFKLGFGPRRGAPDYALFNSLYPALDLPLSKYYNII